MLKFTRHSVVDIAKYQHRINRNGNILIDKTMMQNILDYKGNERDTMQLLSTNVMAMESSSSYADLNSKAIFSFLVGFMGCPEEAFFIDNRENHSLDAKKVLTPLVEMGYAEEFLTYYMKFSSLKSICSRLDKLIERLALAEGRKDHKGTQLYSLTYTASEQENLRFNYSNNDIVSVAKEATLSYTVEDGYFLAWGDAAQADLRIMYNLFIRDEENADIMDRTKDKYEGIARLIHQRTKGDEEFDIEKFKEEREAYKTEILATTYGKAKGTTLRTQEFAEKFKRFLATCPRYVEYKKRLGDAFDLGLVTTFTGYFGYEQSQMGGKYKGAKQEFINKGLNTPIQTGTSEVIVLTVNALLDRFYSLGYTEDDISIYMVRHDEPVFKISKNAMKDIWILNEASQILVDNWTPLEINFSFGYNYAVVDTDLTNEAISVYRQNEHRLATFAQDTSAMPYWPIKNQMNLYVGSAEVGGKTLLCIYAKNGDDDKGTMDYLLCDSTDRKEVFDFLNENLGYGADYIFEKDYGGVIIHNKFFKEEVFHVGVYYKYVDGSDPRRVFADCAAHIRAAQYAKKYNITGFVMDESVIRNNFEAVKSVGDLGVFKASGEHSS